MIELLDSLGAKKAIWVGHDWGAPVVWSIAQHHPERCHGVANLCVPYSRTALRSRPSFRSPTAPSIQSTSFRPRNGTISCSIARISPSRRPGSSATSARRSARSSARAIPQAGASPRATSFTRANGGWFRPRNAAPDVPRDPAVLSEEDEHRYVAALERNGFFGPDSWYMNWQANLAYAERAKANWQLDMPVLFLHAAYDYVCETLVSRLADPMRAHCEQPDRSTIRSGHWMAQEKPAEVNAALAKWLGAQFPALWAQ